MFISVKKSTFQLLITLIGVALLVAMMSIVVIYNAILKEKKILLKELSDIQSGTIKSICKFTKDKNEILKILNSQQEFTQGIGETGEFTIAYLKNDTIFFILDHRYYDYATPKPILLKSDIGIPIKYALSKNEGYVNGLDYRGTEVMAYADYIPELNWGIVTKIDMSELRAPFYRAGLYALISSVLLIVVASLIFKRISAPIMKKIIDNEKQLTLITDNIPDCMMHVSRDLKFLFVNQKYADWYGKSKAELIGKKLEEVILKNNYELILPYIEVVLNGEAVSFEAPVTLPDNKQYSVHAICVPQTDDSGNVIAFYAVIHDITERKKVEVELFNTKSYLENLINFANAPIIVWDEKLRIQLFNLAFENLTGYTFMEVKGRRLDFLFPEDNLERTREMIRQAISGDYLETSEIPILCKNGDVRIVLWNSANIYGTDNKTLISTIAQGNDITERKRAEEQLERYAMELKNFNATKDKFFGIIAHDLKNPFSSLLGASELLYENAYIYDSEKVKKFSKILNDSARSGYNLLENLLEWSRTQTGDISFYPSTVDINEIVDCNFANLKMFATNKNIELRSEIKEDMMIIADKNMLNTILRNLLSNAIKFTFNDGNVTVIVKDNASHVMFSVRDTGTGIEKENIEKLFRIDTKYFNVGTANERGTGLGLLLCKEFVEKHYGKIWVESEFGKGSEFKFTISKKITDAKN